MAAARNLFTVELFLPLFVFLTRLAEKGSQCPDVQECVVHPVKRLPQRTREVHEQHHPITVGVVPHLMIEGVVED